MKRSIYYALVAIAVLLALVVAYENLTVATSSKRHGQIIDQAGRKSTLESLLSKFPYHAISEEELLRTVGPPDLATTQTDQIGSAYVYFTPRNSFIILKLHNGRIDEIGYGSDSENSFAGWQTFEKYLTSHQPCRGTADCRPEN